MPDWLKITALVVAVVIAGAVFILGAACLMLRDPDEWDDDPSY
jgi:hypothetical protein